MGEMQDQRAVVDFGTVESGVKGEVKMEMATYASTDSLSLYEWFFRN